MRATARFAFRDNEKPRASGAEVVIVRSAAEIALGQEAAATVVVTPAVTMAAVPAVMASRMMPSAVVMAMAAPAVVPAVAHEFGRGLVRHSRSTRRKWRRAGRTRQPDQKSEGQENPM